jgi:hypothetical protein
MPTEDPESSVLVWPRCWSTHANLVVPHEPADFERRYRGSHA